MVLSWGFGKPNRKNREGAAATILATACFTRDFWTSRASVEV